MELYQQIFFTTLALSFGILHLILYVFNKQFKSNLIFAGFLFLFAFSIFVDFQAGLPSTKEASFVYLRLHRAVMPYPSVFILLFTYYAFNFKIPKQFWYIVTIVAISGFFAVLEPNQNFIYLQIALVIVNFEIIRVFVLALKNKKHDALIIITGFLILMLFSLYDLFMDFDMISPIFNINNGYPFGFFFLIIFSSIYLARDFARTNKLVLIKEREAKEMEISQKLLEAEDKRKSKELNEARDLQLSLLPQCVTNINNFDICFDMRTASEVGGDYYDYDISESGEISIVIGDATDHGMKAGMMVSIIKSLFLTNANNMRITDFLNNCSQTIKQMNLKNLYMALMLLKLSGNKLTVSSAGIPPLLIYRKKRNVVEEIKIKGMPLGALNSFPYESIETELDLGDTVLLMTDGLPELFNKEKKSFGYERVKEVFLLCANEPVTDIASELFSAGEKWIIDCKQNDDITFVVFRLSK